jgi:hypothetical protein
MRIKVTGYITHEETRLVDIEDEQFRELQDHEIDANQMLTEEWGEQVSYEYHGASDSSWELVEESEANND